MIKDFKRQFQNGNKLTQLIYINLGVFFLMNLFFAFASLIQLNPETYTKWLELPADLSKLTQQPWSIITYMFLHKGFLHILFNLMCLYFGGRIFMIYLNTKQLVSTYILGGFFGGLCYILAYNFFPALKENISTPLLGASASVLAILTAIATYVPNYSVHLTLIGKIKLKYIVFFSILLDLIAIQELTNTGGHIAHLGGALYGFLYVRQLKDGKDWSRNFSRLMDALANSFKKQPLKTVHRKPKTDDQWREEKALSQKEINRILDKISKSGYDSLNEKEKETLFKASKK